jgi:hypothetical protein
LSYEGTDTSLSSSTTTRSYALPASIDNIRKIIVTSGSVDYEQDKSLWTEEAGGIYFKNFPTMTGTMKLIGRKQLVTTDAIPTKYVNYVISAAIVKAYEDLMVKYQSGLLMSDTTQAEIMTALSYWRNQKEEEERKLDNKTKVSY